MNNPQYVIVYLPPVLAWLVGIACALTIFVRTLDFYRWTIIIRAAAKGAIMAAQVRKKKIVQFPK